MPVKVSVVVPVYNTENYLENCLNSLVTQTLQDIEIVIVNDGSDDNSQTIIDLFVSKYPDKIIALQQENKGPGAARNFGVSRSSGEFIGFVDSDDWVERDMYEQLYNIAVNEYCDIVMCDIYRVSSESGEKKIKKAHLGIEVGLQTVADYVRISTFQPSSSNKIFKHDLVEKTPFPDIWAEDVATIPVIISNATKITYCLKPLYYYQNRPSSLTSDPSRMNCSGLIEAWQRCLSECNPAYKEEMIYAVYFSISTYIATRREHMIDLLTYFWKHEDIFKNNKHIREELQNGTLMNLFDILDNTSGANVTVSHIVKNLTEFIIDTQELIDNLEKLPHETLSELYNMFDIALQSATENPVEVGPKLLIQLSNRHELIMEQLNK